MRLPDGYPDVVDFCRELAPASPYHKDLKELHGALSGLAPGAELAPRLAALIRLCRWIRDPAPPAAAGAGTDGLPRNQHKRLALVLDCIERVPVWREALVGTLAGALAETSALHLFAEVGVPNDRGFLEETMDRLAQKLLPKAREDRELSDTFTAAFPGARDADWLGELPPELVARVAALLGPDRWAPLWRGVADAVRLIATRVSALGLTEELRNRSTPMAKLDESPFFVLPSLCDGLVEGTVSLIDVHVAADRCRTELRVVHGHLERAGVSVDIVYRMDVIAQSLARLELLGVLLDGGADRALRQAHVPQVMKALVEADLNDRSLGRLVRHNTQLLARKVIERVGSTGEHYITRSRKEWWAMLRSAGGGGVLTAGTAALKFIIGWAKLPIFVDAFLSALNYAGSFVIMQLVGFTLATKQPSMTAAALAAALRSRSAATRTEELVGMIARMTRSQLAAAIGNVGLVIPTVMLLDFLYRSSTGTHFLDAKTSAYVVGSFHPLESPVLWFATLTGVFLWMASLGAGWLENWAVYRRMPEAIEQSSLRRIIGPGGARRLAMGFRRHVAGVGGSVTLGGLLAFMPVFGKGWGLPIGVAHVTLSAGSLALAGVSLGLDGVLTKEYLAAMIGVACIGMLNFGVSFALALWVAVRARAVGRKEQLGVLRALVVHVFKKPIDFLYPAKNEPGHDDAHGHRADSEHDAGAGPDLAALVPAAIEPPPTDPRGSGPDHRGGHH